MYLKLNNINVRINNKNYIIKSQDNNSCLNIYNGVFLKMQIDVNTLNLSIINTSKNDIILNNLSFESFSLNKKDYDSILQYDNSLKKTVEIHPIKDKITSSYLFTAFSSSDCASFLLGFLGSKTSYTSINFDYSKNNISINPSYNFVNHILKSNEEIILDPLYFSWDISYTNMISSYVSKILDIYINEIPMKNMKFYEMQKRSLQSMFFTKKPQSFSLKVNGSYVKSKSSTPYAIDISSKDGQDYILLWINEHLKNDILEIHDLVEYLELTASKKAFNSFYEINNFLSIIKKVFPNITICVSDIPIGLCPGYNIAYKKIVHQSKTIFLNNSKYEFNHQFLINSILYNLFYIHNEKHVIKNAEMKELLELFINTNFKEYDSSSIYNDISLSLKKSHKILPYLYKNNVFGFLLYTDSDIYIGVFNFSSKASSFTWNFSYALKDITLDDIVKNEFSDENFMISDNILSLKKIPSMDCMLFKKSINKNKYKDVIA